MPEKSGDDKKSDLVEHVTRLIEEHMMTVLARLVVEYIKYRPLVWDTRTEWANPHIREKSMTPAGHTIEMGNPYIEMGNPYRGLTCGICALYTFGEGAPTEWTVTVDPPQWIFPGIVQKVQNSSRPASRPKAPDWTKSCDFDMKDCVYADLYGCFSVYGLYEHGPRSDYRPSVYSLRRSDYHPSVYSLRVDLAEGTIEMTANGIPSMQDNHVAGISACAPSVAIRQNTRVTISSVKEIDIITDSAQ